MTSYAISVFLSICLDLYLLRLTSVSRIALVLAFTLLAAGSLFYLWRFRDIPLVRLRKLELLMLGLGFVGVSYFSLLRIDALRAMPPLSDALKPFFADHRHQLLFPDGSLYFPHATGSFCSPIILAWGFFMVGYGVLVPNTWRRSAIILSLMVTNALGCILYGAYLFPPLRSVLGLSLFFTFFTTAGFAAMSLYGSHKLDVLRGEVLAAMQVGQYSLKQQLGKGGMGEVYLAQHRLLRRPCAVKLIRAERAGDASSLLRFEREVQAMAQLTHPNTVEIYDYGRTDEGMFYYAMEYLPGLSAEEFIRRLGIIPPGRAIYLLRQICGALHEAHAAGLIHRDIKPANIFICERGRIHDVIKLLDFGLVQVQADALPTDSAPSPSLPPGPSDPAHDDTHDGRSNLKLTLAGHILGTPAYMSPEQARGEPADARSDIFGIGAVAYFLVSGRPPFSRPLGSPLTQSQSIERSRPQPLSSYVAGLDAGFDAVIMRCLEHDPARRYGSVAELEAALEGCADARKWSAAEAARWWAALGPEGQAPAPPLAADSSSGSRARASDLSNESANLHLSS